MAAHWIIDTADCGTVYVSAGGTAIDTTVSFGGDETVVGTASGTTIYAGGTQLRSERRHNAPDAPDAGDEAEPF